MRITVEIGFSFKRDLSGDYRSLDLADGTDVARALQVLVDRHPGLGGRIFGPGGDMRRDVSVLINGRNATRRDGPKTILHDGDRLTLLPPVGAG